MSETEKAEQNIIIIPCSGGEYNGELARQVAIRLSENSEISTFSSMFCSTIFLKNILLKKDRLVEITTNHLKASFIVVIDGCGTSCITTILKDLNIVPNLVVHIDELVPKPKLNINDIDAFKNQPRLSNIKKDDIEKVTNLVFKKLRDAGVLK